jgi:hypothetical protein
VISLFSGHAAVGQPENRVGDPVRFRVELGREDNGRWIAEVIELPGVLAYGGTSSEAQAKVQALALRVGAERLEHGEAASDSLDISFQAA